MRTPVSAERKSALRPHERAKPRPQASQRALARSSAGRQAACAPSAACARPHATLTPGCVHRQPLAGAAAVGLRSLPLQSDACVELARHKLDAGEVYPEAIALLLHARGLLERLPSGGGAASHAEARARSSYNLAHALMRRGHFAAGKLWVACTATDGRVSRREREEPSVLSAQDVASEAAARYAEILQAAGEEEADRAAVREPAAREARLEHPSPARLDQQPSGVRTCLHSRGRAWAPTPLLKTRPSAPPPPPLHSSWFDRARLPSRFRARGLVSQRALWDALELVTLTRTCGGDYEGALRACKRQIKKGDELNRAVPVRIAPRGEWRVWWRVWWRGGWRGGCRVWWGRERWSKSATLMHGLPIS